MKRIVSKDDLALHGAAPAYASPIHVGRPNIGDREKFLRLVDGMFDRGWLSNNGPLVMEFERRLSQELDVKHCVAMCNGTIALEIAIRAVGLQSEVIVPSYTFIATAHALHWQGITPVFADIDPATHNLDPEDVLRKITPRTTGIIGVHLWGRPAPVDALQAIADTHGLQLLFDAAHAFGCSAGSRLIGGFGRAEVFSFHATKCFNTFEGGAVTTNDDALAEQMRLMRNFGFAGFDNVIHPGTNGKMIEACAAMGLVNLDDFDRVVAANRANHCRYGEALSGIDGVRLLDYPEVDRSNYQYVVVEVADDAPFARDDVLAALTAENILARRYFWPGCHAMQPYRTLYPQAGESLPSTRAVAGRVLVLPTGATLPDGAVETVGDVLRVLAQG